MATTTTGFEPVTEAHDHIDVYVRAFNSGDPDLLLALYADDAVSVWEGQAMTGQPRRDALAEILGGGPKMTATIRESHVTADAALMIVDWMVETPQPDGTTETMSGQAVDVLRRAADGRWRHVIDHPHGAER
ncbi:MULTISPECIES: YybH family protein [Saccharothrix]|uniref:YybH family protein n=1 Tax=Saccharothrix TaxID=2071 RepID=UPI00093E066C|nr:SgcJ/EcaC family oxidoreductase [Saccharothrix sp. CB00851]OKI36440.1 hypothetical protein A6A25_22145 [Saccharothrix sp. CB00851]